MSGYARRFSIAVTNGWSDDNRGDSAILLGMVALIKRCYPETTISVISEFDYTDPTYATSYWALSQIYPDVRVFPSLFPYPKGATLKERVTRGFRAAEAFLAQNFPTLATLFFRQHVEQETWQALSKSDLVLSKGGHIFYSEQCTPRVVGRNLKLSFPLLLGARLGIRTAIYSQSMGPFNGFVCRALIRQIFNSLSALSVREEISMRVLQELGVRRPIYLVPDAAFLLPVDSFKSDIKRVPILDNETVIMTPRQWGFKQPHLYKRYLEALAKTGRWLLDQGFSVALISHTIGPNTAEDDRIAVRDLVREFELIGVQVGRLRLVDTAGWTALDLIDLYSQAKFLIGTRFHSVIFALLGGTPAIAVSYFGPKSTGIMKYLGLGEFVLDIHEVNESTLTKVGEMVLTNYGQLKSEIKHKIALVRAEALDSGCEFLRAVLE